MDELVQAFSVERIGKSGTKFDIEKAKWFNRQYLHAMPESELSRYLIEGLAIKGITVTEEAAARAAALVKDRTTFPSDFAEEAAMLFGKPTVYDEKTAASKWNDEAVAVLTAFREELLKLDTVEHEAAKHLLHTITDGLNIKIGKVMQAVRLSITGRSAGPDLMTIIEILGPKETAARIGSALDQLKKYLPATA